MACFEPAGLHAHFAKLLKIKARAAARAAAALEGDGPIDILVYVTVVE
jgi:hypothetical protein